jgi:hypothetical protein
VTSLDLAGPVLVAGRALDLDEASVVALADLEAATSVLAATRQAARHRRRPAGGWFCAPIPSAIVAVRPRRSRSTEPTVPGRAGLGLRGPGCEGPCR